MVSQLLNTALQMSPREIVPTILPSFTTGKQRLFFNNIVVAALY